MHPRKANTLLIPLGLFIMLVYSEESLPNVVFKDEALVETSLSLEATLASGDAKLPFRLPS